MTDSQQISKIKKELKEQAEVDHIQEEQINRLQLELDKQKERTKFALNLSLKAVKELERETKKQIATAIIAAFGFLIALVWRDAITSYTNHIVDFFKFPAGETFNVLYVALLTTFIAVVGIVLIGFWVPKKEEILKEASANSVP